MGFNLDITTYINEDELKKLERALPKAEKYYNKRIDPTDKEYKTFGVGGNTFRVFKGIEKPSLIYRDWAKNIIESVAFKDALLAIQSEDQFEQLYLWLAKNLTEYWKKKTRQKLLLSYKHKFIDLFIKHACRRNLPNPQMNKNLLAYGHVPIDSNVFAALDCIFSGIFIAEGQTMGSIKTEEVYQFYQHLIKRIMHDFKAPALYFDFYAWNLEKEEEKKKKIT